MSSGSVRPEQTDIVTVFTHKGVLQFVSVFEMRTLLGHMATQSPVAATLLLSARDGKI
jgi:hypothetical protein